MRGVVGALFAFYHDSLDIEPQHREISAIRLVAKMPTWPYWFTSTRGNPCNAHRPDVRGKLPAHDVQHPVRDQTDQPGTAGRATGPDLHPPRRPRAERLHPLPCARRSCQTRSPVLPPVSPHCGACPRRQNETVLTMLDEIGGDVSNIDKFIAKAKMNDPAKSTWASVTGSTRTATHAPPS